MKHPAGRLKWKLGFISVTGENEPRDLNSTGPPRASQTARPKRDPRMREERDGVGMVSDLTRNFLRFNLATSLEHPRLVSKDCLRDLGAWSVFCKKSLGGGASERLASAEN